MKRLTAEEIVVITNINKVASIVDIEALKIKTIDKDTYIYLVIDDKEIKYPAEIHEAVKAAKIAKVIQTVAKNMAGHRIEIKIGDES